LLSPNGSGRAGQKRFPEFEGEPWVEVVLGEAFQRVTEKNEAEKITNVLTISAQDGLVSQTDYYNKSVASKDLSRYIVLKKGDFAYNKSYSEGYPLGAIKRLEEYESGVLSPLYICFRPDSSTVDSDFMTHFFENGGLDHEIYKIAREGARNHGLLNVSIKDFLKITFKVPKMEEQKRIASVLNQAKKEIGLLESELTAIKKQKKGLMQQLLTGKVRVNKEVDYQHAL
jgi:type I restriction enzyme S subunit